MKNLKESLLDDDDKLFGDTDIMKDFPGLENCNDYPFPDDNDDNYGYYKWDVIYPNLVSKIKGDILYSYYEPWGDYEGIWRVGLLSSTKNKDFYKANEFYSTSIDVNNSAHNKVTYRSKKEARKLAYELLLNIAKNPSIIDYLIKSKEDVLDLYVIQKEFKNNWIKIK